MKSVKNLVITGLIGAFCFAASLATFMTNKENEAVKVSADGEYVVYTNEDLDIPDFPTLANHYVAAETGGRVYRGKVLGDNDHQKIELKLSMKVGDQAQFWVSVGGYAFYSTSSECKMRFLYLTDNGLNDWGRNRDVAGVDFEMRADDDSYLKNVEGYGVFGKYSDWDLKFDLSGTYATVEFSITYQGVTYYPKYGETWYKTHTFTHVPINIDGDERYQFFAGTIVQDEDHILDFAPPQFDLATIMSPGAAAFEDAAIGDFYFIINLSESIFNNQGYINDHQDSYLDKNGQPIDIVNNIVINDKTLKEWIDFNDVHLTYDTSTDHGIHCSPLRLGPVFSPVALHITNTGLNFKINRSYISPDDIILTFKAAGFKGFNSTSFKEFYLNEDLSFYTTLDRNNFTKIKVVSSRNEEVVGNAKITKITQSEGTASQGAKFQRFRIYTNIPRDKANIIQEFPCDNYRYVFDNIILNGKSLAFYNTWGRGNDKDFLDLSSKTVNNDYETEIPGGNDNASKPLYRLTTYVWMPKKIDGVTQDYYAFIIEIPNKLIEDFEYDKENLEFSIRENSTWHVPGGVARYKSDGFENVIENKISELNNYVDVSLYRDDDKDSISLLIGDATDSIRDAFTEAEMTAIVNDTKAKIDLFKTDEQLVYEEYILPVENLITALPNPNVATENDADAINAALEAYILLSKDNQKKVDSDLVDKLYELHKIVYLMEYKAYAITEITSLVNLDLYFETERTAIAGYLAAANSAINASENIEAVDNAINAFHASFDGKKTAKELAIAKLDSIDLSMWRETQRTKVSQIIASGKIAINNCKTAEEIGTLLAKIKDVINNISSDDEMSEYEALADDRAIAIKAINDKYADLLAKNKYTNANKQQLDVAKDNGLFAVEIALNKQAITKAVEDAVKAMEAVDVVAKPNPDPEVDPVLESISIDITDAKVRYVAGEAFSYAGIVVTAHYTKDKEDAVVTNVVFSIPDMNTAGQKEVYVFYTEDRITRFDSFYITIDEAPVTLVSIEITSVPDKVIYNSKEELSLEGLVVVAHYSDNTSSEIEISDLTISELDSSEAGQQYITVSYTEDGVTKTASFVVTIVTQKAKACGGDITATSVILSSISLLGVGLILLKKKRRVE